MLLGVAVLAVKAQEWGAVVSAGVQGVSQSASGVIRALGGCRFMT